MDQSERPGKYGHTGSERQGPRHAPDDHGRFLRVANPVPGNWQVLVNPRGTASPFVTRAYVRNPANHLAVGIRYSSVVPNGDIYVYAYPKTGDWR
jgi:hypothetical protein